MAISLGTIVLDLQANTASFVSGIDKAAQISLNSTKNIQKAFSAMGGILVGVLGTIEASVLAMVDASIEGAAKLEDLAQSAGISTAGLSALDYAAKQSGISQEQLVKGVEKLSKAMLAAAQAPTAQANAFKTLGVAVTDATGKLRPTEDVLTDIAGKFATMQDGPMKTALAMQLFGKAGADLVPLLNRGKAGITDLMDEAKKLGIVVDEDFAANAKHFEESMNKLKAAAQGTANTLARELLPSFQLVIDNITEGATESQSRFKDVLAAAGLGVKAFIVAFGALQTFFDGLGAEIKHFGADVVLQFETIANAGTAIWHRNWDELKAAVKGGTAAMAEEDRRSAAEQTKIWKDYADGVSAFWNARPEGNKAPARTGAAPAPAPKQEGLKFEQTLEDRIAKLGAAADAEGRLANAISTETAETIKNTAAAQAQKTIDDLNAEGKKHHIQLTEQQKEAIVDATLRLEAYKSALDVNKQLSAAIVKQEEEATSVRGLATAYGESSEAIEKAQEKAKLTPFIHDVDQLSAAYNEMVASGKFTEAQLLVLSSALDKAKEKLEQEAKAVHAVAQAQTDLKSAELSKQLKDETSDLEKETTAILGGAAALRQWNIEHKVAEFARANPLASAAELEQYRTELTAVSHAEALKAAAAKVNAIDKRKDDQQEILDLQAIREQIVKNGGDTTAVDAAIHEANLKLQDDYTQLLLKTDSYANGAVAALRKVATESETSAQAIANVMDKAFTGLEDNIAKLIVTGKANFSDLMNSIEEDLIKLAEKRLFEKLLSGLFDSNNDNGGGGGGGSFFGNILSSLFSSGKAGGGDVMPGKVYPVGEEGPELFAPGRSGTIIPNNAMNMGGGGDSYEFHFHGVTDFDSFKQSKDQLAADMQQRMWAAHSRNR
jgi:lambda family phage tail tape measure protein